MVSRLDVFGAYKNERLQRLNRKFFTKKAITRKFEMIRAKQNTSSAGQQQRDVTLAAYEVKTKA